MAYAGGCYEHCKYIECLSSCDKLLGIDAVEQNFKYQIQALRCKALFKIYQTDFGLLRNEQDSLSTQEFHEREKSCYDKLHRVIGRLGAAFDKKSIDDEGLLILDYAMINLICGTNELNKLRRCMLCLQQCHDLKRSHIIPKSVLEIFRTGFIHHQGNKGLIVAGAQSSRGLVYHSEKTITKFMLCGNCEMLLSKEGEQDFVTNFFKKIYNPSNFETLMEGRKLSYQSWLYHFCIGVIFRAIAGFVGIPNVMNHHEVYSLFTRCRKFLLEGTCCAVALPEVHVLANPTKIPCEYEKEWVNEALVEPAFFDIPNIRLSNGNACHFPEAHFFVIHFGILNMLITFSPAGDVPIPEQFFINPNGGMFVVPPEEQRLEFLPEGIKTVFGRVSENIKEDMIKFLFRREKPFPSVVATKEADKAMQDTVGLIEAINTDFDLLMKSGSKINYLPTCFHIDEETKTFQLPPDYHMMVHATCTIPVQEFAFTYFIGIVSPLLQPFVIVHQHSKTNVKCFGFLISDDGITVKEYIISTLLVNHPGIVQELDSLTATLSDILPILLPTKGFKDIKALINYFKYRYAV